MEGQHMTCQHRLRQAVVLVGALLLSACGHSTATAPASGKSASVEHPVDPSPYIGPRGCQFIPKASLAKVGFTNPGFPMTSRMPPHAYLCEWDGTSTGGEAPKSVQMTLRSDRGIDYAYGQNEQHMLNAFQTGSIAGYPSVKASTKVGSEKDCLLYVGLADKAYVSLLLTGFADHESACKTGQALAESAITQLKPH